MVPEVRETLYIRLTAREAYAIPAWLQRVTKGFENVGQVVTAVMSSSIVMRFSASGSKIVTRMSFNSFDRGRIDFKKSRSSRYARYVISNREGCFHGLRPHVKFTKMTPRDQISFGAHRYIPELSKHSEERQAGQ
jgi:hypothetical protein